MDIENLNKRILNYRLKNNLTQKDMAKILGITEVTLRKFAQSKAKIITNMKIEQKINELEGEQ